MYTILFVSFITFVHGPAITSQQIGNYADLTTCEAVAQKLINKRNVADGWGDMRSEARCVQITDTKK